MEVLNVKNSHKVHEKTKRCNHAPQTWVVTSVDTTKSNILVESTIREIIQQNHSSVSRLEMAKSKSVFFLCHILTTLVPNFAMLLLK